MIESTLEREEGPAPINMPCGYIRHEPSIELVRTACCAAASPISGETERRIAGGEHYVNLMTFVADVMSSGDIVTSRRRVMDLGRDGKILEPLAQQTGICDGCSFGEAAFVAWCSRFAMSGTGDKPRECSFLWPYLGGRDMSLISPGDTGAIPPFSAQLYHDFGVLPVNCGGRFDMSNLPPHGPNSQESLCEQMRDNPRLLQEWKDAAAPFKCRVYSPQDQWDVADCITTGRPVTFGCSYQARETLPTSIGVSPLYLLGGHETFGSGWFTRNGRLGLIKTESWWNALYPARNWPNHRVVIQTDDGPHTLYPGQSAVWGDEWMRCQPECWAIDAPGSR